MIVQKGVMAQSEIRCSLKRSVTMGTDGNGDVTNWRWILLYFYCMCMCMCVGAQYTAA